jgi:hypothetical protein
VHSHWHRLGDDGLHPLVNHGDADFRDRVPLVRDEAGAKEAVVPFQVELLFHQLGEQ